MEHPYYGPQEIADIIRHRVDMRHFFPDKYNSEELASGELYLPDEMEEYKESILDAIEKERLKRQRARRERIGTLHPLIGIEKMQVSF